jgi:hypothetical protein
MSGILSGFAADLANIRSAAWGNSCRECTSSSVEPWRNHGVAETLSLQGQK